MWLGSTIIFLREVTVVRLLPIVFSRKPIPISIIVCVCPAAIISPLSVNAIWITFLA